MPCVAGQPLSVVVDPSIAGLVRDAVASWPPGHQLAGSCVRPTVDAVPSAQEAAALTRADPVDAPALWLPDSSLWSAQVAAARPKLGLRSGPVLASSPLVAVAGQPTPALAGQAGSGLAATIASGAASMTDPLTTTEGALSLTTLQSLPPVTMPGLAAGVNARAVQAMLVAARRGLLPSAAAGFAAIGHEPSFSFVTSEQQALAGHARPTYFGGAVPGLDYRLACPPAGAGPRQQLVNSVAGQLSAAFTPSALARADLRDPAGDPLASDLPGSGSSRQIQPRPAPGAAELSDDRQVWVRATRLIRLLVVIDVSGSMGDSDGSGQTKIQSVAGIGSGSQGLVGLLPDQDEIGVWAFAKDRGPGTDYAPMVPIGPLGAQLGAQTRRQVIDASTAQLPTMVGGDTGLYSTAVAADRAMLGSYLPGATNAVLLITDGQNVDPGGPTLEQAEATLRGLGQPDRPAPIYSIGIGAGADIPALAALGAATGGQAFSVATAEQVAGMMLSIIFGPG